MKIKSLGLKNFKRFTNLTLQNIPEGTKLVLLIGSNGSGKSSVFDAFESLSTKLIGGVSKDGYHYPNYNEQHADYYYKNGQPSDLYIKFVGSKEFRCTYQVDKSVEISGNINDSKIFYGRTAIRYLSRITKTSIGQLIDLQKDEDRPKTYIDIDNRFQNDIDLLIREVIEKVFQGINNDSTKQLEDIKQFLAQINEAFPRIFGTENGTKLIFKSFIPPADGKPTRLIFQKGSSEINYDLLSAGEKEVVNLLFNLFVRSRIYSDSIYFLDEIDTHLNTKLQFDLIKEITENWIPANCQLWTASHSLGFIDYANDSDEAVIFDFDDLDFDQPQVLTPKTKNNFEVFEIAVGKAFIDKVVQGRKIIFSENTDTPFYNDLAIDNVFFFVANDKMDVFHKAKNHHHFGLMDRDYLSEDEIADIKRVYPFLYILPYYSFENLIYHPENLSEYYSKKAQPFDAAAYTQQLVHIKNEQKDYLLTGIIGARSGYPFFKENEHAKKLKTFREAYKEVVDLLRSDEFENFYKVFPAKNYGTQLLERQNIVPEDLTKTRWFTHQIKQTIT